jgi:predicted RNA binding protein YcfA (HicA-like mRNA interferase family)
MRYTIVVKRRLVVKAVEEAGYIWERGDGDHDIYAKEGHAPVQIPKHKEININTARNILDIAGARHRLKK